MPPEPPRLRTLARAWFDIGTQSVGGGTSVLFMIRRIFVEQRRWLTLRELNEGQALSQLSPGVHLIALCGMFGHKIGGIRGMVVSLAAMVIPAALITTALAAFYSGIERLPVTTNALAGVLPVTGGMTFGFGLGMIWSIRRHGWRFALDGVLVTIATAAMLFANVSTIILILVSAVIGGLFLGKERPTTSHPTTI